MNNTPCRLAFPAASLSSASPAPRNGSHVICANMVHLERWSTPSHPQHPLSGGARGMDGRKGARVHEGFRNGFRGCFLLLRGWEGISRVRHGDLGPSSWQTGPSGAQGAAARNRCLGPQVFDLDPVHWCRCSMLAPRSRRFNPRDGVAAVYNIEPFKYETLGPLC